MCTRVLSILQMDNLCVVTILKKFFLHVSKQNTNWLEAFRSDNEPRQSLNDLSNLPIRGQDSIQSRKLAW